LGPEGKEPRSWIQTGLALIGAVVAVAVAVGLGLFTYNQSLAIPLHTTAADIQSVLQAPPSHEWAGAVEQGRQRVREGVIGRNLPGLSVAVGVGGDGSGGGIVWAEGFGWADVEKRVPVSPDVRFRTGHVSKALTSAAVGLLVEQGRLDLDEEIQTYVPAFPRKQWSVTLRQLMGDVSGVRHYEGAADATPSAHCEKAVEGVRLFADDPLRFQPDTQYRYSTFGWVLVSAAVEAAADEPFFTFVRTKIFEPSGMRDTTTDSVASTIPNLTAFYSPRLRDDTWFGPESAAGVDYSCFSGAGAFLSTPSDLVRFGLALNGAKLLKPATVSMLQTPQMLLSGEETRYGLGWMLETFPFAGEPTRVAGHNSRTIVGSSTWLMSLPERGIVVAVMSNTSSASLRAITLDIAQAFATAQRPAPVNAK
jgi:CubicO group peptidase (beta-lactamase class C family)